AATIPLYSGLGRMEGVIDKLLIRAENMQRNLDLTQGVVHSQRALLALTQAGIEREKAYKLVQGNAMRAWAGEGTLLELLKPDPNVASVVPAKDLEAMFDNEY